jgi:hypothetical protein
LHAQFHQLAYFCAEDTEGAVPFVVSLSSQLTEAVAALNMRYSKASNRRVTGRSRLHAL